MARRWRSPNDHGLVPGRRLPRWLRRSERADLDCVVSPSTFFLFTARLYSGDLSEIRRELIRSKVLDIHFDQADKRTAEVRLGCTASIYNHSDCRDDAAMGMHDVDCFLHASATSDNVFDDDEFLVRRNLETAAQNEFAFVFLYKNVPFA